LLCKQRLNRVLIEKSVSSLLTVLRMAELINFDDVLKRCKGQKTHLLLGNGFSIAKFPKLFAYDALFSQADFAGNGRLESVFNRLQTHDFEKVMRFLIMMSATASEYGLSAEAIIDVKNDIEALKQILIQTICEIHPDGSNEIDDDSYTKCFSFLKHFLSQKGSHIYTLNYDLLLYWTLARIGLSDKTCGNRINDGFSGASTGNYLIWQGEGQAAFSTIRYPHGALHIFDAGQDIQKITFNRTNERLLDQVREALDSGLFPLFVSEGTFGEKLEKIKHNAYLYDCYQRYCADIKFARDLGGGSDTALVIFGHSMDESDDHFWAPLMKGNSSQIYVDVYVSVYQGLESSGGLDLQKNVDRLKKKFSASKVQFGYFKAESIELW
jgi:hypothetical protein